MFTSYSTNQKIAAGLIVVGLAAGGLYFHHKSPSSALLTTPAPKTLSLASERLTQSVKTHYAHCYKEILDIYQAAGLTPLLLDKLSKNPHESDLMILNSTLQEILLRPRDKGRHQLDDTVYLEDMQKRLKGAYQKAGLPAPSSINREALYALLANPNVWSHPAPKPEKPIDMALLYGSSYEEYLNRQSFFFELLSEKAITLKPDETGKFPTYLLGGDRDLDPKLDAPFFKVFANQHANEQMMMNMLFEKALKAPHAQSLGEIPLYAIATDSAKEDGNRPTTSGTLDSFIEMAHLTSGEPKHIVAISSAPFIRYQHLVGYRQLLKYGVDMNNIQLTTLGPDMPHQMKTQPELAKRALIAICLDNLAREVYEMKLIEELKAKKGLKASP